MLMIFSQAYGEIEKVVLRWKPGFCTDSCLVNLEKRLRDMPEVTELKFQAAQNQATIRWKPNRRFSYRLLDTTMRRVGVNLHEIFVTVRGTVNASSKTLSIKSIGDDTEFILLSPISVKPGEAAVEKNIQSHMLKPQTRERLVEAEKKEKIVTVEGPLFQPQRAPPLFLINQRIAIPPTW